MTALAKGRTTRRIEGDLRVGPAKAAVLLFPGALVCIDAAGWLVPGGNATAVRAVGRVERLCDNQLGANAALNVEYRTGVFLYENATGGDALSQADLLATCYVLDDQTVARTIGSGARAVAGKFLGLDADTGQAMVAVGEGQVRKAYLSLLIDDLRGAQAKVYRTVAPRAGAITAIWSALDAALATGDATLTGKIGATAITAGVVTITQAGSAAGDVDSATPTALNVVAAGDVISLTVGGPNTAQVATRVLIEISY